MRRDEAKRVILDSIKPKGSQRVVLDEAFGRVLGSDIYAKFDIPEANKSAIDGYVFNLDSIESFPAKLRVVGESRAGFPFAGEVKKGETIFTMTGAVVADGADTAVRLEDVELKEDTITIKKAPKKGDLINFRGGELKESQRVLDAGETLDYKKVALLANIGYYQIEVYSHPKIGIVITGDEVTEPWENSSSAGIKNSNLYILKGLLSPFADIKYYGIIQDEPEKMLPIFENALNESDILLSSGGASKGKYDFTKDIASKLGLNIHITSTNIRPGRPLIFATKEEKLFFGLPGYPSALLTNALEFLVPALKKMAGFREYKHKIIKAVSKDSLKSKEGRVDFIRVNLEYGDDGVLYAKSSGSQQTSNFLSLAFSDALVVADETKGSIKAGDLVDILPLGDIFGE